MCFLILYTYNKLVHSPQLLRLRLRGLQWLYAGTHVLPGAIEEIVQLEEEMFDMWNTACWSMREGEILHFGQEKEVTGTLGMNDSQDRAKAGTYIGKVIASEIAVLVAIDEWMVRE